MLGIQVRLACGRVLVALGNPSACTNPNPVAALRMVTHAPPALWIDWAAAMCLTRAFKQRMTL